MGAAALSREQAEHDDPHCRWLRGPPLSGQEPPRRLGQRGRHSPPRADLKSLLSEPRKSWLMRLATSGSLQNLAQSVESVGDACTTGLVVIATPAPPCVRAPS